MHQTPKLFFTVATIATVALLISCSSQVVDRSPQHHFSFTPNNTDIQLSSTDSAWLVNRYLTMHTDKVDTVDWPFPDNKQTMRIVIDVSGTMFSKGYNIYCNGKNISFFDYSMSEMRKTFQKEGLLKNTSIIRVQLFGAQVKGMSYSLGDYEEITIPDQKLILKELYYPQDNNRIDIDVLGSINNTTFNVIDSVFSVIKRMTRPFSGESAPRAIVNKSQLLQDIIFNTDDLKLIHGKKGIFYMTDGYFEYSPRAEFIPSSTRSLNELKDQFTSLRERIPVDSSIQYIFYGMNSMQDLQYRNKLNGFYQWFLKDNINHLKIYNLK